MSTDAPADFGARRWATIERSDAHSPRAVLVEALRQLDAGETAMHHVIVAYGDVVDGAASLGWLSGGSFNSLEQRGLLQGVTMAMYDARRGAS